MSWEDFCQHFTTINICVLVNTSVLSLQTTYDEGAPHGSWHIGSNAGGCINNKDTFYTKPSVQVIIRTVFLRKQPSGGNYFQKLEGIDLT